MGRSESRPIALIHTHLGDRMTNESTVEAPFREIGCFERKNHQQVIEKTGDHFCPAWPPCPNGGRHVMHERGTASFELLAQSEGESRRIDRHYHIRIELFNTPRGLIEAPE
jgi:hypothetical protein